jgi:hypothetical protein
MQCFGIYPTNLRSNFLTLFPSKYGYGGVVTVFQILTGGLPD